MSRSTLINTYKCAARLFATARSAKAGKPIRSWGRLFKVGDNFELKVSNYSETVCTITPDDKIIFNLSPERLRFISNTLSYCLSDVVPLEIMRIGKGRYRIDHVVGLLNKVSNHSASGSSISKWFILKKESPEVYEGITFDLKTGECLNPRKDIFKSVNTEVRKQWVKDLRAFNLRIKTLDKLGVLDTLIQELIIDDGKLYSQIRNSWGQLSPSKTINEHIADTIKSGNVTTKFLQEVFVLRFNPWFLRTRTGTIYSATNMILSVLNNESISIRKYYGVFDN